MIRFVNAKINLGLNIIRKRPDGYHDIETAFYPVGLFNRSPENPEPFGDILEIHLSRHNGEDEFVFAGNPIDCVPEKNLVCKAVAAFRSEIAKRGKILPGVNIILDKHLPEGAGLGGGSADASFCLSLLNELAGYPMDKETLIRTAASLGADCPFFIENSPVFAEGTGDRMQPIPLNLNGYWSVIVKPEIFISTKIAFAGVTPSEPKAKITEILEQPPVQWESLGLKNDFEDSIFPQFPELADIKKKQYERGALYAAMSGSGSSIFGIYSDRKEAEAVYKDFAVCNKLKSFICKL